MSLKFYLFILIYLLYLFIIYLNKVIFILLYYLFLHCFSPNVSTGPCDPRRNHPINFLNKWNLFILCNATEKYRSATKAMPFTLQFNFKENWIKTSLDQNCEGKSWDKKKDKKKSHWLRILIKRISFWNAGWWLVGWMLTSELLPHHYCIVCYNVRVLVKIFEI